MEGIQKHGGGGGGGRGGGGGCEGGAVGHSEHVAASTIRSNTHRHSVSSTPATRSSPKYEEKKKKTRREAEMGRRMHGGDAAMGRCVCFDHARLMVAWWHNTEGGEMLTCPLVMQSNVHVRSSFSLSTCFSG